jgi:hypothetical protein
MDKPIGIRKPRVDERPLFDVLLGIWGYPAIFVAHELKLFELLAERPLALDEVCAAKKLARRPAEALLAVCASIGLVELKEGRFALTALAEDYMLPSSPNLLWLGPRCLAVGLFSLVAGFVARGCADGPPPGSVRRSGWDLRRMAH